MAQARGVPQDQSRSSFFQTFTTAELVILAVLGVVLGVGGTPMAMLFRFLNTAGGEIGWALSATILGWFYLAGVLGGYIVRKPGAATLCEVISGVGQVLSGNPNGVIVLFTTFAQGFGADLGYALFRYRSWGLVPVMVAGVLSVPFGYVADAVFFGIPLLGPSFYLAAVIRMVSGAVFAVIGVAIIRAVAKAGVLRGTALDREAHVA
jgi:energy-coupling factor transport system permease protein